MRPLFLDNPPRYTSTARKMRDAVDYACAVQRQDKTGYPYLWYLAVVMLLAAGLLFACQPVAV